MDEKGIAFDKSFLKKVLAVPSASYREERMRDFVLAFAAERGIKAETDKIGNVYLTKGISRGGVYVPCFINHMDTVQDPQRGYVDRNEPLPVKERKSEAGKTELYVEGYGIGGDDKAGVALALGLMEALPSCKAVFFVQEEIGMVGSAEMNYDFLGDVSLLVTMDCWGRVRTASEWRRNGARMFSQDFYQNVLKPVYARHGVEVLDHPANTDICRLMMNCDLCCCDIGNGGYKPHCEDEYVCVEDAVAGYDLILDLCRTLDPARRYRIAKEERGGDAGEAKTGNGR